MKKRNKGEKGIESSHSTSILFWITIKIQIDNQHVVDSVLPIFTLILTVWMS